MKTLRHTPLFKLACCFIVGIILGKIIGSPIVWALLLAIPLYLLCLILDQKVASMRFEILISISIYLSSVCAGALSFVARWEEPATDLVPLNCEQVRIVGIADSDVKVNSYGRKVWVQLAGYVEDSMLIPIRGKLLMYIDKEEAVSLHKHDSIFATVYITDLRSKYDSYLAYLRQNGISHAAYCKAIVTGEPQPDFRYYANTLQRALSGKLELLIPERDIAGIAQAMFLGDKRALSSETREAFAHAGVSHVLAISGLHVGIIYLMLNSVFQILHLIRFGRRLKYILMLLLLLAYMVLTGASPAVVRAVIMFATILIFKISYQRYHILNLVAVSALVQMIWDPTVVFHLGFELSYSAVTGIIILHPIFERAVKSPYPLLNKVYGWIGVTLAAQLSTLPLILIHFQQFPTYFLLSNVCIVLITSAAVLSGFATVVFIWVPGLNAALGFLTYLLLGALQGFCFWIARLPHALITDFSFGNTGLHLLGLQLLLTGLILIAPKIKPVLIQRKNLSPGSIFS